jgi:hypothetical protein
MGRRVETGALWLKADAAAKIHCRRTAGVLRSLAGYSL